jgi:hypothetical protein
MFKRGWNNFGAVCGAPGDIFINLTMENARLTIIKFCPQRRPTDRNK